ncbi:MAG: conjugal transfer protein TrbI, partial [Pseudomonadota bacterium]
MTDPAKTISDKMSTDRIDPREQPKADPDTLVLRGSPNRIVRFRRGAIIGIAALGSIAIAGLAWMALTPATFEMLASGENEPQLQSTAPDALADVPANYGDVPQLGPPLPGDLGKPILDRQRELGLAPEDAEQAAVRAAQEAEAERQRIAAETLAARESGVMMQLASAERASGFGAAPILDEQPLIDTPNAVSVPNRQTRKENFVNRPQDRSAVSQNALVP